MKLLTQSSTIITISSLFVLLYLNGCTSSLPNTAYNTQKKNEMNFPHACLDLKGKFLPVKAIRTKIYYNEKPSAYRPIRNQQGFIKYDFNKDKKTDYIFIERDSTKIKLVTCISRKNSYLRKQTPFAIHEVDQIDFQTISESIQMQQNNLILTSNKHEHNWGSDSESNRYTYDIKNNDFVLKERTITSSSGDGMRSDTYENYNLNIQRYQKQSKCGFAEEGCSLQRIQTESGRLVLPRIKPTLYKQGKVYKRLIPD